MKDSNLIFYLDPAGKWGRWYDGGPTDLHTGSLDEVPASGGAYVLGATGAQLVYPWGVSPIYYIGKADNLSRRLCEHQRLVTKCAEDCWTLYWRTRYQYGTAHGMVAVWYELQNDETAAVLESDLLERFYCQYGSIPVANDKWDWGRLKQTADEA